VQLTPLTCLCFDYTPTLASLGCQRFPDLLSEFQVFYCQTVQSFRSPVLMGSAFNQSLVTLTTSICCLVGKVLRCGRLPIETSCSSSNQDFIIGGTPIDRVSVTWLRFCRAGLPCVCYGKGRLTEIRGYSLDLRHLENRA
jgi:hypothetical protein